MEYIKKGVDIKELFAFNLARLRKDAGFAQIDLAMKCGFKHNYINELENKKKYASYKTIGKLCEALNAEPIQFFINPKHWKNADKILYVAIKEDLIKNITMALDKYINIESKEKLEKTNG